MESLRREIDPIEQKVLDTLTEELTLARAALRDPEAPMWQYVCDNVTDGGLNSPDLVEIRKTDDQPDTPEDN